jgi:hypothetical protein
VPLLAEAMAQTGTPSVLIVASPQNRLNGFVDAMKQAGYLTAGATDADSAVNAAAALPAVDVLAIAEDLGNSEVEHTLTIANQSLRLRGAIKIIMTKTAASPYAARSVSDPTIMAMPIADAASLKAAVDVARTRSSSVPMDAKLATEYSLRAGELLHRLAITKAHILDLGPAEPELLAALNDPRPEVVKQAGAVLAVWNSKDAQRGMITIALAEKTPDDVKISLFKSVATSAKFFGNQLSDEQIAALQKVVETAANLEVRSAAAEARGALNLPANQAKQLIVKQSRV